MPYCQQRLHPACFKQSSSANYPKAISQLPGRSTKEDSVQENKIQNTKKKQQQKKRNNDIAKKNKQKNKKKKDNGVNEIIENKGRIKKKGKVNTDNNGVKCVRQGGEK